MIGIVVISHSRPLARAAVALASEMLHDTAVPIEIAAGLDEQTFGTDASAVAAAIAAADRGAGVLMLMDLGSAVLSAELALDLLEGEHRTRLCSAPLLEGLIAATVAAAGGADLDTAAAEAENSLAGKRTQLGEPAIAAVESPSVPDDPHTGSPDAVATFVIHNEHGLHARPAARLVAELRGHDARVWLRNLTTGRGPASGSSLSRVAALGALRGHEIEVTATGSAAGEVVERIRALAGRHFDETATTPSAAPAAPAGEQNGGPRAASPGIALGPIHRSGPVEFTLPDAPGGTPDEESIRLDGALGTARTAIERARAGAGAEAGIFDAHLLLLEDEELLADVRRHITDGLPAATAWARVMDCAAAELDGLADEYQRARAADLRAVRDQVLAGLLGVGVDLAGVTGILVASDLTPAQAAALDPAVVLGVVLAQGSSTSHAMILTRSRGIPAVVSAGPGILAVPEGTIVALDGATGRLVVDPDPDTRAEFDHSARQQSRRRAAALSAAAQPARTLDGKLVHLAANIGDLDDAAIAVRHGADMAGLVRTEFLFLGRDHAPTIDEQEHTYRAIAEAFDGRRVVLRTLDVGGDKPLPYVTQPPEANPFLGVRGIRLALARPQLLRDQLTAICRVAADHPVSVMFPMITRLDELSAARRILDEVATPGATPEVGIMVEVPAAAAKTAAFAPHVDFFSIGTNDLVQYALAAERGNDAVAPLADALDPGVLHLIDMVCRNAGDARVAVCGEAAADPTAIPLLLGLGVDELSVAPPAIPLVKAAVREYDSSASACTAAQALHCASAEEVRALTQHHAAMADVR
ncbi:phosphoenolpyruvate--protein phosphotransferase [Nocardia sp. ET3-3]|uniref:Phosphocarrier protein HPr n=1 Tax=Nocardia terrae TaxID=2675851 RepID=A0A7K1UTW3_9NOCA|nr:phosphoenolpyruvate--protein phosphotransferase [Nocardia terrae]MVU77609.1 phosphoenolpyruvate--protein phosphotransferase [Nocardia terrae]